jgi:hypothetical protein
MGMKFLIEFHREQGIFTQFPKNMRIFAQCPQGIFAFSFRGNIGSIVHGNFRREFGGWAWEYMLKLHGNILSMPIRIYCLGA